MRRDLIKRAYREAAALLRSDCDAVDLLCELDPDVTADEVWAIREYIRKEVVDLLAKRGGEL